MGVTSQTLLAHAKRDRHECPLREWVFGLSPFGRPVLERVALHAAELSLVAWERGIGREPGRWQLARNPALREGVLAAQTGAVTAAQFEAASTLVTQAEFWWDEWCCTAAQGLQRDRLVRAGDSIVWMLSVFTWTPEKATAGCLDDAERDAITHAGPVFATWCALFHCQCAGAAPSDYRLRRQLKDLLLHPNYLPVTPAARSSRRTMRNTSART